MKILFIPHDSESIHNFQKLIFWMFIVDGKKKVEHNSEGMCSTRTINSAHSAELSRSSSPNKAAVASISFI